MWVFSNIIDINNQFNKWIVRVNITNGKDYQTIFLYFNEYPIDKFIENAVLIYLESLNN